MCVPWKTLAAAVSAWAVVVASFGVHAEGDAGDRSGDGESDVVVTVEEDAVDLRAPSLWRSSQHTAKLSARGGDLAEALGDLPGTYATSRGAIGSPTEVTLRGASAGQVLLLIDGFALNPARGGGVDLSLLPLDLLSRVDVYRGGSATRFGGGAVGGAVDVIPRLPDEGVRLSAHGGGGSFGTLRAGVGASGGGTRDRALVSIDWLSSQGDFEYADGQGSLHERRNADVARLGGLAVVEVERGSTTLRLLDMAVHADRGSPGPSEFQQTFDEARLKDATNVLGARLESRDLAAVGPAVVDGSLAASWRHGLTEYANPDRLLRALVPFETTAIEDDLASSASVSMLGPRLVSVAEIEARRARYVRSELDTVGVVQEDTFVRQGATAALHLEWTVLSRVSVLPAARVEWVEGLGLVGAPSLGIMVSPAATVDLVANVGRAWRAPSLDELYLSNEAVEGDPHLRPEDAISSDFGAVWRPAPWCRAELAAFFLAIDDLILFLPVSSVLYRAQNTGGASSVGLEGALTLRPSPAVKLEASYTLTRARRDEAPRAPLPGRPVHKGGATASVRAGALEVFGRVSARSTVFLDRFGNLQNGPATFLDAGASLELAPGLCLTLTGKNLLDRRDALDASHYPLPGMGLFAQLNWNSQVAHR